MPSHLAIVSKFILFYNPLNELIGHASYIDAIQPERASSMWNGYEMKCRYCHIVDAGNVDSLFSRHRP